MTIVEQLCKTWIVSEARATVLVTKHPSLTADEIAAEEALEEQVWMEPEDYGRESDDS